MFLCNISLLKKVQVIKVCSDSGYAPSPSADLQVPVVREVVSSTVGNSQPVYRTLQTPLRLPTVAVLQSAPQHVDSHTLRVVGADIAAKFEEVAGGAPVTGVPLRGVVVARVLHVVIHTSQPRLGDHTPRTLVRVEEKLLGTAELCSKLAKT